MDGADAESEVDSVGFTASYEEYDPAGCEVEDQSPAGGEVLAEGDSVELVLDCRQRDWEHQEGDDWTSYQEAFDSAAEEGCQALFNTTNNGSLYDDDYEYDSSDCLSVSMPEAADDAPAEVPDDPESVGASLGFDEGCGALFDYFRGYSVYWGEDAFYEEDCTYLNPY